MSTQTELDQAKAAYHKLLIGKAVVSVTVDGVQTSYAQADSGKLKAHIESMQVELGTTSKRRRPFGVR